MCNPLQIHKYRSKVSRLLLDRIDIHVGVPPVRYKELADEAGGEKSGDIKSRVNLTCPPL